MSDLFDATTFANQGLTEWALDDNSIHRRIETADFASALVLVNQIGDAAEAANHHPDLELGWGRVVVHLSSHDAGGVTDRDVALARQIDALV